MKKILIIFALFLLASCFPHSTPGIFFENCSYKNIYNVKVVWNGYHMRIPNKIGVGGSHSFNFYIKRKSQFFGPVNVEWKNADGEIITKNFEFKEEELQLPFNKLWYGIIKLEFVQNEVIHFTNQIPDYEKYRLNRCSMAREKFDIKKP